MNKKLKVAIVGFGWFGKQHFKVYENLSNVEVVAICDINVNNIDKEKSLQDEFHKDVAKEDVFDFQNIKIYNDITELLLNENIDLIDVVSIESEHYNLAKRALLSGKNIIIEKPMTISYSDAKELYDIAIENKLVFYVGNILRFDDRYRALNDLIKEKNKDDIRHLSLERNFQSKSHYVYGRVNPAYSACIHDIDLTLWLSKSNVKSVYAYGSHFLNRENPDVIICILELENGAVSVIQNVWHINDNCPYGFEFSTKIILDDGTYMIRNEPIIHCWTKNGVEYPELFFWPTIDGAIQGCLLKELGHYVDCALNNIESNILPMKEAIESIKIANAIEISLNEKRKIYLKEVR